MASHWTYEDVGDPTELEQGDILRPTDGLRRVLSSVHPHFIDDKYLGYIVTTQSCDLVRRRNSSKASYINIAVVRPLSQVIRKIAAAVAVPVGIGVFRSSDKDEVRRLLERVLNQNEQAIGLFFLSADSDAGIAEPAVAFLRVSVALRAEHYDILCSARVGRLTPQFRAKLGWLVGNLYVRPSTPDWGDTRDGKNRADALIKQCTTDIKWLDDEVVEAALSLGRSVDTEKPEDLEKLRPPSKLDRAIEEVQAELGRIEPTLTTERLKKLGNRLRNNGKFTKLFRK